VLQQDLNFITLLRLCALCLVLGRATAAHCASKGEIFWGEPFVGVVLQGQFREGDAKADYQGLAYGARGMAILGGRFFLGGALLLAQHELTFPGDSGLTNATAKLTSFGGSLGLITRPLRFWYLHLFHSKLRQEQTNDLAGGVVGISKKLGDGYQVGISLWPWRHLSLSLEYTQHKFEKDNSDTMLRPLHLKSLIITLGIPFPL